MAVTRDGLLGEVRSLAIYIQHEGPFSFSFSREGLREHSQPSLTTGIKMKATDVTQNSLGVSKSALAAENPILGTWKLQSMVYEATATGERSSPFGDHPDGYLSYSADGRTYAIGVVEDRPKPRDPVPTDEEKVKLQESMFAYAGTYTADGKKVVHHVDISWNQSWTGTDLVRFYELDGNL
jgi:hypothetical protein